MKNEAFQTFILDLLRPLGGRSGTVEGMGRAIACRTESVSLSRRRQSNGGFTGEGAGNPAE